MEAFVTKYLNLCCYDKPCGYSKCSIVQTIILRVKSESVHQVKGTSVLHT